jgi:hypothetical protein
MFLLVGVLALIGALYLLGTWGSDDEPEREAAAPNQSPTATPASDGDGENKKKKKRKQEKPTVARFQIQPTGPVSVCLENAAGEPLVENVTLQANQDTETFRSKRFRVSFGTGEAVMRVDGRAYQVSDDAPIGYEVRAGGRPKTLPESERPTCAG